MIGGVQFLPSGNLVSSNPSPRPSAHSGGLVAAGNISPDCPFCVSNHITLNCTHSEITIAGVDDCHDQASVVVIMEGSFALKAIMDTGYSFYDFTGTPSDTVGGGLYTTSNPTTLDAQTCNYCTGAVTVNGPYCSVSLSNLAVVYGGVHYSATLSWTVATVSSSGSGTLTYSLSSSQLSQNVSGTPTVVSPTTNSYTLTGLNAPQVYSYVLTATYTCTGVPNPYHIAKAATGGDLWAVTSAAGSCPEGNVAISSPTNAITASENNLSWTETPTTTNPGHTDTLDWGLTTSYTYNAWTPPAGYVYLQELKPSTTYDYKIVAFAGLWTYNCYNGGSVTGSFTTHAASTAPSTFSGHVFDQSGHPAPQNIGIVILCEPAQFDYNWGLTSSSGTYSIQMPSDCIQSATSYKLELENPCPPVSPGCSGAATWPGVWNETVITYITGVVDFNLNANSATTYVPASAAFIHTPDATVQYANSFWTGQQQAWNYGGNPGSTSEQSQITVTYQGTAGATVLIKAEYYASGTAIFDATNARQLFLGGLTYFDEHGAQELQNASAWTDWYSSAPSGGYCDSFQGPTSTFTLDLSTSFTTSSGYDISIGVSAGPSWANVGVSVPLQNTLTSVSGQNTAITADLTNPGSGTVYFEVFTDGGNGGSNTNNAVLHVWLVNSC